MTYPLPTHMLVLIEFDLDNRQVYQCQAVRGVLFWGVEFYALPIWISELQRRVLHCRVWESFNKIGAVGRHGEPAYNSKGAIPQRWWPICSPSKCPG